jgi:hypothetical protein
MTKNQKIMQCSYCKEYEPVKQLKFFENGKRMCEECQADLR